MTLPTQKEFYGDQVVNNFRTVLMGFLKIFWGLVALLLATIIFGLIIGGENVAEYRDGILQLLMNQSGQLAGTACRIFFIWLILVVLPLLPVLLLLTRKLIILPRNSFTLTAMSGVESKEKSNRARKRKIYEIQLRHPADQQLVAVRIDKKNYEKLLLGDEVQVYYRSGDSTALYVALPE